MATTSFQGKATTADAAVVCLSTTDLAGLRPTSATILNEGSVAGYVSLDGGSNWYWLPENYARTFDENIIDVRIKRVPSGSNLSDISGDVR